MNVLRHMYWIALPLALACTTKQPQPEPEQEPKPEVEPPEPKPLPSEEGFFMADGAPPPRGCTVATDCLGDTIADEKNPCCQNPYRLEAHARAYREWVYSWRKDNCASVECPPPPPPAEPPPCHFEVDCVQGRCVDSCKD